MAHYCKTCSEPCYCMGDYEEVLTGQPAYCRHCTEWREPYDDDTERYWDKDYPENQHNEEKPE